MSAPGITYSGVLAKKVASNHPGVGVFSGLRFWISVRVPQRKGCVETIEVQDMTVSPELSSANISQKHGGTVVPREHNADMLICDPAREPVPSSYSYKLIADAVKDDSLESKDDYLCSSLVAQAGSPKAVSKPKLTRSMFTKKDDEILSRFVIEKESLGERINGNDIYKQFAEDVCSYPPHCSVFILTCLISIRTIPGSHGEIDGLKN